MFKKPNPYDQEVIDAADIGNLDRLKELVEKHKADVNTVDSYGRSAGLLAAKRNDLEMVRYLASQNADLSQGDALNQTPMSWAQENQNLDMMNCIQTNQMENTRSQETEIKFYM